jgi:phosphate transport system substrate-binding protein
MKKLLALFALAFAFSAQAQTVKVDGSSTVFPITEGIAEDFQIANKNAIKVTVGLSGTGGGFKKFCSDASDQTDINDASRPITQAEIDACAKLGIKYYELPIAFDALTVVVNPKNTFVKQLSTADLKKMWEPAAQSVVSKWNQVNPAFPETTLKLFGPGTDSGTFDYFTEAVNGKAKSSRGDFTASEDDNILVRGVESEVGGLAYFGFAYYNPKLMKAVAIVNKDGKAVLPSKETVLDGSYNPLSRPLFIYVNAKSLEKPEVKKFVEFYMSKATTIASEVKYIPLPSVVYQKNLEHLKNGRTGTIFGGTNQVGLTIDQLTSKEAK